MRFLGTLIFGLLVLGQSADAGEWQKAPQPLSFSPFRAMAVSAQASLITATENEIYQQLPDGQWKKMWHLDASRGILFKILAFKEVPHSLFILTHKGLFEAHLLTQSFKQIFHGRTPLENAALSFFIDPDRPSHWLLGTRAGLFESADAGNSWKKVSSFKSDAVSMIAKSGAHFYIGANRELISTRDLHRLRRQFLLMISPDEINEDLEEPAVSETFFFRNFFEHDERLFIGSAKGLHIYHQSSGWKTLSVPGESISRLLYQAALFIQTPTGLYRYRESSQFFEPLSRGLRHEPLVDFIHDSASGRLFALSAYDLFEYRHDPRIDNEMPPVSSALAGLFSELLRLEPHIGKVREQVIRYNDISPQKMKRWHRLSRMKSFLPSVSIDRDFSEGSNIDLDRGSTSDPDQYIAGPNEFDESLGVGIRWDLGDFLWSSAQTSIDSRAKSNTDLRQDLLQEAVRLYFERRRIQVNLVFEEPPDIRDYLESLIRMDEVSALIDALTGGWFSEQIRLVYENHPSLERLWMKFPDVKNYSGMNLRVS